MSLSEVSVSFRMWSARNQRDQRWNVIQLSLCSQSCIINRQIITRLIIIRLEIQQFPSHPIDTLHLLPSKTPAYKESLTKVFLGEFADLSA